MDLEDQHEEALNIQVIDLKALGSHNQGGKLKLGPRIETTVKVNGTALTALVDTGSPVTIISNERLMDIWKSDHPNMRVQGAYTIKAQEPFSFIEEL